MTMITDATFTLLCIAVVQSLSRVQLFETPWTVACQAPLSSTITRSLLKFMSIESVMPSVIFCFPVLKEITPGRCWPVQLGHYPTVLTGYLLPSFCLLAQLLSRVQLFVTPLTAACQAFLSFTISQSLLKFMSIESVVLSNHLILCCSLFLLPSVFPSIRVFSSELALHIR